MSMNALELPLFPLSSVLFPGTVMPLHIFEPRYRQMIVDCQREEMPFGFVMAREESKHLLEIPYSIGTIAEIRNLERLEDGRYTLMAVGTKRFRILSQHRQKSYLSGIVEVMEEEQESAQELAPPTKQAGELFETYLNMLLEVANERDVQANLPEVPDELSYFIAYFLDIEEEKKQHFLEMNSTKQRLEEEVAILRREVPFMRQILSKKIPDERTRLN